MVNITGGSDLAIMEVDQATNIIFEEAGQGANIIFGAVIDPDLKDEIMVTVIATKPPGLVYTMGWFNLKVFGQKKMMIMIIMMGFLFTAVSRMFVFAPRENIFID